MDLESSTCIHRLSCLAVYPCSAGSPAASLQPSHPSSPFSLLLARFSHKCSKCLFQAMCFPLPFGHWAFSPGRLVSHLTSTSDTCLGLLPLSQTVPCTGDLREIFASPPAIAAVLTGTVSCQGHLLTFAVSRWWRRTLG